MKPRPVALIILLLAAAMLAVGCLRSADKAPVTSAPVKMVKPVVESATPVHFDQLDLNLPLDVLFEDKMLTEEARRLNGKRITLKGLMYDTISLKPVEEFALLRNTESFHGSTVHADQIVRVLLRSGEMTKMTKKTVTVTGNLQIDPFTGDDGVTWSIYLLKDAICSQQ